MTTWCPRRDPSILFGALPDGSAVLCEPRSRRAYGINLTAAYIWQLCTGEESVEDITARLLEDFDATPETVTPEIESLLNDLVSRSLLEAPKPAST